MRDSEDITAYVFSLRRLWLLSLARLYQTNSSYVATEEKEITIIFLVVVHLLNLLMELFFVVVATHLMSPSFFFFGDFFALFCFCLGPYFIP